MNPRRLPRLKKNRPAHKPAPKAELSLLGALAVALSIFPGTFAHGSISHAPLDLWLLGAGDLSAEERVIQGSALLLGTPYLADPLGEGPEGRYDQDPRSRLDAFDCTTFVETVLAFTRARSTAELTEVLDAIRYDGHPIEYPARNHFTSLDWIPHLVRTGYLREVTHDLATNSGIAFRTATALIDKPRWYRTKRIEQLALKSGLSENERTQRLVEWRAEGQQFKAELASIDYIPFEEFLRPEGKTLLQTLPRVAILNLVRPNWDLTHAIGTHLNVSHQLLLLRDETGTFKVRHADFVQGKVREENFLDYLRRYQNHPTARGLNVLALSEGIVR